MKKFKPISFANATSGPYRRNLFQQNMLLKALPHTDDLKDLKKVAHFHTEADVLRTLDKLAIRREYHEALAKNGMGPDKIVAGIKEVAECAEKDGDRLKAYQTLLRSLGLDTYDATENDGKNWEEVLLKIYDKEKEEIGSKSSVGDVIEGQIYQVEIPEVPESVKKQREEDGFVEKSLYE